MPSNPSKSVTPNVDRPYTKGKWRSIHNRVVVGSVTTIAIAAQGKFIPREEANANARVMAAAPELVDAVELLIQALESETQNAAVKAAKKLLKKIGGPRG